MIAQQIVNGLMLGGIYVLIAVAFTLAIGVLNFLNFSIPATFMIGGMVSWAMIGMGWHWTVAFCLAVLLAGLVGLAVYWFTYRPSRGSDPELPLVSSLGFLVLLENLVIIALGSDQQSFPQIIADLNIRLASLVIGGAQLISLIVSLGFVIAVSLFLAWTSAGRQIRAVAENRNTAELLGINVAAIVPRLFVFSAMFTAFGGILFSMSYLQVSPFMGENLGFKGVSAMIVGGMGSVWGAVVGGLLIGIVEVLTTATLGSGHVNITVYGLLLLLVVVRPEGLLGKPAAKEKL